ncbi:MAG: hypothetical protein ACFCVD_12735 [Nodosilinea sp.]
MFTGLDLIVILLVLTTIAYATSSGGDSEFKLEPLTLLVVIIVVGMIVISLYGG